MLIPTGMQFLQDIICLRSISREQICQRQAQGLAALLAVLLKVNVAWATRCPHVDVHTNPVVAHTNPVDVHTNPVVAHPNPVDVHTNPVVAHPNPVEAHTNPVVAHPNPVDVHTNPVDAHPNPVGAHSVVPTLTSSLLGRKDNKERDVEECVWRIKSTKHKHCNKERLYIFPADICASADSKRKRRLPKEKNDDDHRKERKTNKEKKRRKQKRKK
ncbi:hypothetical protein C0Q70_17707 [Pomacea canaliculata]|uniref:Uncharacterized protein n=1 Tax=Pomacea canaliculata TaxID=400727 RepID=A0A2T7NL62_POMCA|nr:hypothetical protein C0Q70_17707 [Pomacea canaliculata]